MAAHSSYVTRLLDTLKEEQIAENTPGSLDESLWRDFLGHGPLVEGF